MIFCNLSYQNKRVTVIELRNEKKQNVIGCSQLGKSKIFNMKKYQTIAIYLFPGFYYRGPRPQFVYDSPGSILEAKALNVYQINLIQTLKFMHKNKYGKNPRIFLPKFREVDHQCPRRFSQNSFCYKRSACKTTSFAITFRGPTIWNSFLSQHEKSIPHLLSF